MRNLLNQSGVVHTLPLLIIVAAVGIISFLLISSTLPINGLFGSINPKPKSHAASSAAITTPLKVSTINSHYFVDGNGKAVYLSGSHTWNDFQDMDTSTSPAPFDFTSYVNFLKSHGHNVTILWKKDLPRACGWGAGGTWTQAQFPWMRMGPGNAGDGKPKFDLSMFDQTYFDRLHARALQLQQNNIYAIVQLFDGLQLQNNRCGSGSDGFPFSGVNNVNGVDDGGGTGSINMTAPNAITNFQDAYVKKVIDTLSDLPNVILEVSEEAPGGSGWWQNHITSVAQSYEATKPMPHPVGNASLDSMFGSANEWVAPFSRISPSNNQGKVLINDSDHSFYDGPGWGATALQWRNYVWGNFTNGSSVIFMEPYIIAWPNRNNPAGPIVNGVGTAPDTRWNSVRDNMGAAVVYGNKMNLLATHTNGNLSSTGNVLANTAATGSEFLVYAPSGGSFTVNLSNTTRSFNVEWYNPTSNTFITAGPIAGGSSSQSFTPPFGGDAVLYLVDSGGVAPPPPPPTPSPTPAPGAITLMQSSTLDTTGTSSTVSYNSNVTAGNLLIAAVRFGNKTATGTVTDNNGNNWTLIDRQADNGGGNGDTLELWYATNAKITPNVRPTLTINSSVSATIRAVIEEYSNVATTNPLDQHTTAIGLSGTLSATSGVTIQTNELAIGYGELESGSAFTPDSNFIIDQSIATKLATEYRVLSSTGAQTATFAVSTQNWAMGIATFKAAAITSPSPSAIPTLSPTHSPTPSPTPSCSKGPLGDIDCNNLINLFDYSTLVTNFGKQVPNNTLGDLDGNGVVNLFDYSTLVTNFGK